jgi:hypothetical protein
MLVGINDKSAAKTSITVSGTPVHSVQVLLYSSFKKFHDISPQKIPLRVYVDGIYKQSVRDNAIKLIKQVIQQSPKHRSRSFIANHFTDIYYLF